MSLPEQIQVPENRKMSAPYNFVPLPEEVYYAYSSKEEIPKHDIYDQDLYTGFIDLEILNETYLYTRCAYSPSLEEERVYRCPEKQQFFHYKNKIQPVIPGSSIRGMLRSLSEILGYCKISQEQVLDEHLIYRDVAGMTSLAEGYRRTMQDIKAGYLYSDKGLHWIQPAKEINGMTFGKIKPKDLKGIQANEQGVPVWFIPKAKITDIKEREDNKRPGQEWKAGILIKSGEFQNNKKCYVIFDQNNDANKKIHIPDKLWRLFDQDKNVKRGMACRKIDENGGPVFYLLDSNKKSEDNPMGLLFFGPTKMFRIPYEHRTIDFVPKSLRMENGIDLAEAIFGSTQFRTRIRVSDATFIKQIENKSPFINNSNQGRVVPKVLSSPKPTSFQNYLVQPINPKNYPDYADYKLLLSYHHPYVEGETKKLILPKKGEQKSEKINVQGTVIRGYKLYWNKNISKSSIKESPNLVELDDKGIYRFRSNVNKDFKDATKPENQPQNTVISPIIPKCIFKSKIYFENLTDIELGLILTALQLKDNNSRHRLGMGKPYGMGRVKIDCKVRFDNRQERYSSLFSHHFYEDNEKLKRAQGVFEKAIVKHALDQEEGSIWSIPRLQALGCLVHGQGPQETDYVPIGSAWRDRKVLPKPEQLAEIRNTSKQNTTMNRPEARDTRISNGQIVLCYVLNEKTKRGNPKFETSNKLGKGFLHPNSKVPKNIKPGDELYLKVKANDPKNMQFEWDESYNS